jgi:hypothetical protein
MSNRYKGGIISATPPTTNGPFEDGAASGAWTLEQQMQAAAAGTWPLAGNVGPDAFIENLFSTYLYTGNGSSQTINNGINLSGKGGLVWIKSRSSATNHALADSTMNLASYQCLISNGTNALAGNGDLNSFNSNGFSLGFFAGSGNSNGTTYASWTFRKQPKFFDIVTYTGNGTSQNIAHNLGSVPGAIIVKNLSATRNWVVRHRAMGLNDYFNLNQASEVQNNSVVFGGVAPTATDFTVGSGVETNTSGQQYVAYLFAHDAGGFGLTGTDNVISCGSYVGNGTSQEIDLGWEPQWLMVKSASTGGSFYDWYMFDNMRGMNYSTGNNELAANVTRTEGEVFGTDAQIISPTPRGFLAQSSQIAANASGVTYIYIAIRRGPMKVPTTGTSVFSPTLWTTPSSPSNIDLGFPADAALRLRRTTGSPWFISRLTGGGLLNTSNTDAEATNRTYQKWDYQNGYVDNAEIASGQSMVIEGLRRAPGFFDEVCYTGTGVATNFTHNLAVAPELMIVKSRSLSGRNWPVYFGNAGSYINLNQEFGSNLDARYWGAPTASAFTVVTDPDVNASAETYVAYLFASAPGVSKVGSYTGTGTTQTINCGFTGGARFVMVKRTDNDGGWFVWDTARGIVAGNDPYLLLNSTAAEVTNTDYVDTAATGFEISSTAPAAINASGGTFVFLAIA